MNNILEQLNPSQRDAVVNTDGPIMVIAGAGSGKTRVLTFRIAYLLNQGVDAYRILALTFTNKAAREMKERIGNIVGQEARNVWMGTFHAIFARILRRDGHLLGFPSTFTVYDSEDSKRVLRKIIKDLSLDAKQYPVNHIFGKISASKNNLIDAKDYQSNSQLTEKDNLSRIPLFSDIFKLYQDTLFQAKAMDFDDILFKTNVLFRDFPEVLHKYQHQFQYVLVDEYQDTNFAQYLIIKKLSANNENICVVGDDAQSIYSFRGANIENILKFQFDYPKVKQFKLEQNYRSTKNIVNAANTVIAKNTGQLQKTVWTDNEEGEKVCIFRSSSDIEEGRTVAQSIFNMRSSQRAKFSDFAILYRTNAQSRAIEEALRKINIPYLIFGGLSFYQRKEIKDMLAYFRAVINPNDEDALLRIINYPTRGIGETTIQKIIIASEKHKKNIHEIIDDPALYLPDLNNASINKLKSFSTMLAHFRALTQKKNAYELAKQIAQDSGILKSLSDEKTLESIGRVQNIEELLNAIYSFCQEFKENENKDNAFIDEAPTEANFASLGIFMQDVALITDQDTQQNEMKNDNVLLMTIHAAKGLEFPYVYIIGLEEKLFPSFMSLNSRNDLEEERRLFYVALTRAEKQAFLSYAETRYKWGEMSYCEPSRFIEEIDEQFLHNPSSSGKSSYRAPTANFSRSRKATTYRKLEDPSAASTDMPEPTPSTSKLPVEKKHEKPASFPSKDQYTIVPASLLTIGGVVEHQFFGRGVVIEIHPNGANTKTDVRFEKVGTKTLLLRFAKLRIIS